MKTFFYSFILLFVSTIVYAQQSVNYITFFPSAHVVHNTINLQQNADSFTPQSHYNQTTNSDPNLYTVKPGGLILGAARDAVVNINTVTLPSNTNDLVSFINTITVENLLKVEGKVNGNGLIEELIIGADCTEDNNNSCQTVFISAGDLVIQPRGKIGYDGIMGNVYSSGVSKLKPYAVLLGTDALTSSFSVAWVNLRLEGEEVCRPYLVRYTTVTPPTNNCSM